MDGFSLLFINDINYIQNNNKKVCFGQQNELIESVGINNFTFPMVRNLITSQSNRHERAAYADNNTVSVLGNQERRLRSIPPAKGRGMLPTCFQQPYRM